MTNIKFLEDRIILDGHADMKQECETITLLCNSLAKSKDFKTVRYENGYAEFEKVGKANELKFAAEPAVIKMVWDSHATSVSWVNTSGGSGETESASWTTSGEEQTLTGRDTTTGVATVVLEEGYVLNTVAWEGDGAPIGTISGENTFELGNFVNNVNGTATITTKQSGPSDNLTWVINEIPTLGTTEFTQDFISNNTNYNAIRIRPNTLSYYNDSEGIYVPQYEKDSGWLSEANRTITFLNPVTDSALLAWLQANATQAQDSAMNVEITNAYGVRLNTAEKYCEKDIIVAPKLQNKEVTSNGVVAADDGYAGLNSVSVNVSGGGEGSYTNSTPTPSALGGISKGETFSSVSFSDMFTKLLYPYVRPTVTARSTPNGGTYEKGNTQTVTKIEAIITKGTAAITKVEALDGSTVLGEKTSTDFGSSTVTFTVSRTVTTDKSFAVKVTDAESKVYTANTPRFSFVYPYYYGVAGVNAIINETLIKSFTKLTQSKGTKTVCYTATNQRMVFASPYIVSKITDPNGFDVTTTFTMTRVSITGLDKTSQSYYVYTANDASTVSAFKMTFTN